jgi:hypothetical protein
MRAVKRNVARHIRNGGWFLGLFKSVLFFASFRNAGLFIVSHPDELDSFPLLGAHPAC